LLRFKHKQKLAQNHSIKHSATKPIIQVKPNQIIKFVKQYKKALVACTALLGLGVYYVVCSLILGYWWPFSHQNTPIVPSPPGPGSHDSGSSLSVGAIVGIVVGSIFGFFYLLIVMLGVVSKKALFLNIVCFPLRCCGISFPEDNKIKFSLLGYAEFSKKIF
jgi:hypothetical protein